MNARLRPGFVPSSGACLRAWALLAVVAAALPGQGPPPDQKATSTRPLGAPAAFSSAERDVIEIAPGASLRRAPTPSSTVAFEFPPGHPERVTVLERRETASGEWLRVQFAGIFGWYQESTKELDQIAALYENEARLERRRRLAELAAAHFERPATALSWSLPGAGRGVEIPVRVFSDLERRSVRSLHELVACLPDLYASRFGPVVPSRSLPVQIFVFDDQEEYDRFASAELATSIQESGGLELDGLVFVNGATTALSTLGTLAHELAHVMNRFTFPVGAVPVWIEEGIAEDVAHGVEAGVTSGRSPCARPGGWARTRVRESTEFVDGEPTRRTDLQRTGRGRTVLCYEGHGPDDPDIRDLTPLEFGASYRRDVLYLEAVLLVRDLIDDVESPAEVRRLVVDWRRETDSRLMEEVADRVLGALVWRDTERSWMRCP